VERGVWPGKKRSGSPGLVGRDWAEMTQLMQNEPLSLRPAEAVNHVPAVQANLALVSQKSTTPLIKLANSS